MVIHFRGQGLSLRKISCSVKIILIVVVVKSVDSNKLFEILFCIISIN